MSRFNYADYQKVVERAQSSAASNAVKVGFFKLKDNGDEALVRLNCGSLDDLQFASVHTINAGGRWLRVSCLNQIGSYEAHCPLCAANASGNGMISKASKKVYIQMIVSYRDRMTGQFSAPVPVIWERPAAFSRDIANKLRDYGDLRNVLLKITRNGAAGDMKTTYSLDYAVPEVFKPEMVPADFSAFNNFNIAKHSYWEKTPEEIDEFLRTGAFPEVSYHSNANQAPAASAYSAAPTAPSYASQAAPTPAPQAPVQNMGYQQSAPSFRTEQQPAPMSPQPQQVAPQAPQATQTPADEANGRPVRNFGHFSF